MSINHPRIRVKEDGRLIVRDGLLLCFYLHESHRRLGPTVGALLRAYQRFVGPDTLTAFFNEEGDPARLTGRGWTRIFAELSDSSEGHSYNLSLNDSLTEVGAFSFEYFGADLDLLSFKWPGAASYVSLCFPTEFLPEVGAARFEAFALDLAGSLPFTSGYGSLAFNYSKGRDEYDAFRHISNYCFGLPGMDVHHARSTCFDIDAKVRGAYWLNFLGGPVLHQLGGLVSLRRRLASPSINVSPLAGDRAMITLGAQPNAGDPESGDDLSPYRLLAETLKDNLHVGYLPAFAPEDAARWSRRFLTPSK